MSIPYSGDAASRLAAVQQAISAVLSGQEYEFSGPAGRRMQRPSLATLRAMEKELQIEVGQQPGGFTLGEFDRVLD